MRPSDWCPMPRHRRSLVLPFLATVTALVGAACSSTTKTTAREGRPVREGSSRFLRGSK